MGEITGVGWCDHTFNPFWGCVKYGLECLNCYAGVKSEGWPAFKPFFPTAQQLADAHEENLPPDSAAPLWRTSPGNWKEPLRWSLAAKKRGERALVFCASMTDIFLDHPLAHEWRRELWELIKACDGLIWLMLTKRTDMIAKCLPPDWGPAYKHVKFGVTVGHEKSLKRLDPLRDIPLLNPVFISAEPLLSKLDLRRWLDGRLVDCVIGGGESQTSEKEDRIARPTHPSWAYFLRDQCLETRTDFYWKQWGDWIPCCELPDGGSHLYKTVGRGSRTPDYPDDLRIKVCTVKTAVQWGTDGSLHDGLSDGAYLQGTDSMQMFLMGCRRTGNMLGGKLYETRPSIKG